MGHSAMRCGPACPSATNRGPKFRPSPGRPAARAGVASAKRERLNTNRSAPNGDRCAVVAEAGAIVINSTGLGQGRVGGRGGGREYSVLRLLLEASQLARAAWMPVNGRRRPPAVPIWLCRHACASTLALTGACACDRACAHGGPCSGSRCVCVCVGPSGSSISEPQSGSSALT